MIGGRTWNWLVVLAVVGVGGPGAFAQRGEGPRDQPPGRRGEPGGAHSRPGGEHELRGFGLAARLFEIRPEDRGPLTGRETEELLAFARKHMERLGWALQRLRRHDPGRFEEVMAEQAPRLRQLKRVYEHNPRIAEIIREHAQTLFEVRRTVRGLRHLEEDSARADARVERLRELLGQSVELEAEAMEVLAAELEANRDKYVVQRVEYVLGTESDLSEVPEKFLELVDAYHAAGGEGERAKVREEIRQRIEQQLVRRSEALRARSVEFHGEKDAQVEERLEKIREAAEHRGFRDRGRRP